jgi:hypothetical protein
VRVARVDLETTKIDFTLAPEEVTAAPAGKPAARDASGRPHVSQPLSREDMPKAKSARDDIPRPKSSRPPGPKATKRTKR